MKKLTMLLAALLTFILLLAVFRFYFSDADFNPENYWWNGMSSFSSTTNMMPLYGLSGLTSAAPGDTLLIVEPTVNYSAEDAASINSFLSRGGRVVVMDDFGKADSLLNGLDSPVTIRNVPLCQYDDFYINQSCPIVNVSGGSLYTANVSRIVLDHPASLNITGKASVIATSTDMGWLDPNDNSNLDPDEQMGVYPVAAYSQFGNGDLIVISDPDVLVNVMVGKYDNRAFMANILRGRVLVDASHGMDIQPIAVLYYDIKYSLPIQSIIVAVVLSSMIVFLLRRRLGTLIRRYLDVAVVGLYRYGRKYREKFIK